MVEFDLPWPPSVNHYYRHVGPRVLISRDGRKYREVVAGIVRQSGAQMFTGPIAMHGVFYPPDRRRRDLDNVGGKALIDALQGRTGHRLYFPDRSLTYTQAVPSGAVYIIGS